MMPVTLTQSEDARYPDGPSPSGLRVTLSPGLRGAYLRREVPASAMADALYARVMLNPGGATDGQAHILGMWSAADAPLCWVTLDTDARQVYFQTTADESMAAPLPAPLAWHAIELGHDLMAMTATLWVNGVEVAALGLPSADAAASAWIGALNKDDALSGSLDLAYWAVGDAYHGPHRRQVTTEHTGDPARWLVVYNTAAAGADAWADHYRASRDVPYANLCGLDLPTDEVIDEPTMETLRDAVAGYLDRNGLTQSVMGVLLGFGVPGYVTFPGSSTETPVAELLMTDTPGTLPVINPLYHPVLGDRPAAGALAGVRLTGRVDGKDLAEAVALVDRASGLMQGGATPSSDRVWIDPVAGDPSVGPVYTEPVLAWSASLEPERLRLPIERASSGAGHDAVSSDCTVWGWRHAGPPAGFFGPAGSGRSVCMQFRKSVPSAISARDAAAGHWLRAGIDAGYAAVSASSRPYDPGAMPMPGPFYAALRAGWTLAEAWAVARPLLRDGLQLLGDPLLTAPLPKAGYDIFGPGPRVDAVDMQTPIAVLHADDRSLTIEASHWPAPGAVGHYRVRRFGADGTGDAAAASVALQRIDNMLLAPPPAPAWPDKTDWAVRLAGDELELCLAWPDAPPRNAVDRIEIEQQAEDQSVTPLATLSPIRSAVRVYATNHPIMPTRYRFVIRRGLASHPTPWSAWVDAAPSMAQPPVALELYP